MLEKINILAYGLEPPPMTGKTIAFHYFSQFLAEKYNAKIINVAPSVSKGSILFKLAKVLRTIALVPCHLMLHRRTKSTNLLYMSIDGGAGILNDITIIGIARLLGYKLIIHHHSYSYINNSSLLVNIFCKIVGSNCVHLFLCAKMNTDFIKRYNLNGNSMIASNIIMHEMAENGFIPYTNNKTLRLGILSNLTFEKGLKEVLELTKRLYEANYKVEIHLAGPITGEAELKCVTNFARNMPNVVKKYGVVVGSAKTAFFRGIDLFLFPTKYKNEAEPIVIIEALKHGIPIIAYERGCISDTLMVNGCSTIDTKNSFVEIAYRIITKNNENYVSKKYASGIFAHFDHLKDNSGNIESILYKTINILSKSK